MTAIKYPVRPSLTTPFAKSFVMGADGRSICATEDAETARRIAACLNACKDLSVEQVEERAVLS